MSFTEKLAKTTSKNNSLLCVGLDPDPAKFPTVLGNNPAKIFDFNKAIVDATVDIVACYKLNSAFYEAFGPDSIKQMVQTVEYIRSLNPDIPIILDAKRGDIGNTNEQYAAYAFNYVIADAVTIQPYQGAEAVAPFFADSDKGVFVLAKTSNPDSSEFQNIEVNGDPLYIKVIQAFLKRYESNGNCFFVAGATYPEEMKQIRTLIGDAPLLVPGMGAQGGDASQMVPAGLNSTGDGLIINSSRAILYDSNDEDFAEAARTEAIKSKDVINTYR